LPGPAPLPDEVKNRNGNPDHRPARQPTLVGGRIDVGDRVATPPGMSRDAKRAWRQLLAPLVSAGMLDRADLPALELAARCLGTAREMDAVIAKEGSFAQTSQGRSAHPAVAIRNAAMAEFRQWAAKLAIGPANRAIAGQKGTAPDGGMAGELARQLPQRARLSVVGGGEADD
jgi:P27 family predicted phage terminase small subunit